MCGVFVFAWCFAISFVTGFMVGYMGLEEEVEGIQVSSSGLNSRFHVQVFFHNGHASFSWQRKEP